MRSAMYCTVVAKRVTVEEHDDYEMKVASLYIVPETSIPAESPGTKESGP